MSHTSSSPVGDEHGAGLRLKILHPVHKALVVRVAGTRPPALHLAAHLDGLAEEFYLLRALHQRTAQGARRLVAHKEHRALRPPEVVLEMVADAPGFAHAAGREDDLGLGVKVDGPWSRRCSKRA